MEAVACARRDQGHFVRPSCYKTPGRGIASLSLSPFLPLLHPPERKIVTEGMEQKQE